MATASISLRDWGGFGRGRGEILISGPVYDQVHNKLSIEFDCLGRQQLKNVANPVTGYRVLQGGAASQPLASQPRCAKEGARYTATSTGIVRRPTSSLAPGNGYIRLPRLQRRDDRHRSLLVCDQRVRRPRPHLVSGGPPRSCCSIAFLRAAKQEPAVVEKRKNRTRMGVGSLDSVDPFGLMHLAGSADLSLVVNSPERAYAPGEDARRSRHGR